MFEPSPSMCCPSPNVVLRVFCPGGNRDESRTAGLHISTRREKQKRLSFLGDVVQNVKAYTLRTAV